MFRAATAAARRTALAAAVAMALAACGTATGTPAAGGEPSPPAARTSEAAPAAPLDALDGAALLDGARFETASVEGRPTVLWFWAPWCVICRAEAPGIARIAAELEGDPAGPVLLGVAGRGERSAMDAFVAETGTGRMIHVADVEGAVWRAFDVITQPAFALVGADGELEMFQGALGEEGLRAAIAALGET